MIFELLHPSRRPQRGDVLKRGQENENNFKKVKVHSTKIRRTWRGNKLSIVDNKKTWQQARWERRSLMRFWLSGRSWVSCAVILFFGRNRKLAIESELCTRTCLQEGLSFIFEKRYTNQRTGCDWYRIKWQCKNYANWDETCFFESLNDRFENRKCLLQVILIFLLGNVVY